MWAGKLSEDREAGLDSEWGQLSQREQRKEKWINCYQRDKRTKVKYLKLNRYISFFKINSEVKNFIFKKSRDWILANLLKRRDENLKSEWWR